MREREYSVVGMMSGTSLDGMDLILCRFRRIQGQWVFTILKSVTLEYTPAWKRSLSYAASLGSEDFLLLHHEYGRFIGSQIHIFLTENDLSADLVASHGHTLFHQPLKGLTFQLGEGASIATGCNITTVSDFRTLDVTLGGQGAPLVPVGDEMLFSEYKYCLNLGGFANISTSHHGIRIAWDICPVNIVLNNLAQRCGYEFDAGGETGRRGVPDENLIKELNDLEYYEQSGPKSLGREWVETCFMPILDKYGLSIENLARSVYEHIVYQIGRYITEFGEGTILVTGGGAFNTFLLERMGEKLNTTLIIPDEQIVKYKEALIFAFLGLLRYRNEINCLASVTGARCDSSSGIIHLATWK
jgi:anhydro-N-acetylmuramic acid kinase